jgi:isochorismate hydrolase
MPVVNISQIMLIDYMYSAWDRAQFRDAVRATGKKQIIVAGIVTEACTAFLSLSLRAEGYLLLWRYVPFGG